MFGPIARNTLRTSAVFAVRLLIQAGTLLIVARLLGPHNYGAFAGLAALAVILGTVSTFGTHIVFLAEMSKAPEKRDTMLPTALGTTLVCGSILFVVYVLISIVLFKRHDIPIEVIASLGFAELLIQPLLNFPSTECLAQHRVVTSQWIMITPLALRLGVATIIWTAQPGTPLLYYAYGYVLASAIALGLTLQRMPQPWPRLRSWRMAQLPELRHAAGYAAMNITAAGPAELDKTLATRLLPLGAAGIYAASARVIGAFTLPVIAMMLSALPRLFREGETHPLKTARLLRWTFAASLLYSLVLGMAVWILARPISELFGPRYHDIAETLRWLCLALPGLTLRIAAGSALMALGKPWMRVGFEIAGIVMLVLSSMILVSLLGARGMPIALVTAESFMALFGWLLTFKIVMLHSG